MYIYAYTCEFMYIYVCQLNMKIFLQTSCQYYAFIGNNTINRKNMNHESICKEPVKYRYCRIYCSNTKAKSKKKAVFVPTNITYL